MAKKTKRVSTNTLQELVTRSLLIIFSVLLALFLNGIWEQQKVTTNLKAAYRSIRSEVENNRDALHSPIEYHRQSIVLIDSLLNNRTFTAPEFSEILPNGPMLPHLQDAAWNTLHSTGLATHLKYDDVYPLTKLYQLQHENVENEGIKLTKFIHQAEGPEGQHNTTRLKTLRSFLNELYEREKLLLAEMNTALNAGQNWRYLE
ncbi:MAG: hypothetical protein EPGJADBJ_00054 [Saprospiraceae bacterium]|nr:hypothetical protein [Saprospiraceae bacterium]